MDVEETSQADDEAGGSDVIETSIEGTIPADMEPIQGILYYEPIAGAFMEPLLDNSHKHILPWAEQDQTCPSCRDDPTASEVDKVCFIHLHGQLQACTKT